MQHDLVVFVPGILGSRLTRDGRDLWHQSKQAALQLLRPSKAVERLALPPGIGDAEPEAPWAVDADELLKGPDALPGLLSFLGYPDVSGMLGRSPDHHPGGGLRPGQYVAFTYDWRLSNRLTAQRLAARVETALARWQEQAPQHYPEAHDDEPKVVFMCHSMGGLITRHYLECLGGRSIARSLVTIGTPHRGAAKAIRFLTKNGVGTGADQGRLRRRAAQRAARVNSALVDLARTFPSVAQLLPVYRSAMADGDTRWRPLTDVLVPDLPTELVDDAVAFHREFEDAWHGNLAADPVPPYRVHCIGGRAHPTVHGVVVGVDGSLEFPTWLNTKQEWTGDGTVPEESAFFKWALDDMSKAVWGGERHATMAGAESVGHQLVAIRHGKPARQTLAGDDFGLAAPDLAVAGEPFEIVVSGLGDPARTVRARLTRDGVPAGEPVLLAPDGTGSLVADLAGPAGTWVLEVEADRPRVVCRDIVTIVED
ncbi:hypothetical protein [Streptomyces sp. ISL-100]|uniref:lipase/acyltransferase domain-containing protein n=1 Tax=Streptomyces sp. ISL-100 TaxID=2819173 RepID=UPI001BEA9DAE|nr:hypothetical protein [Streptomyces sp. ISL-100]MBT2401450.1 hypothetical protein [Streptomyces sp. ISL-100]